MFQERRRTVRYLLFLLCFSFLLILISAAVGAASSTTPPADSLSLIQQDELAIAGWDLAGGSLEGTVGTLSGITLAPGATNGVLTSLPITTPLPFTDLGPQWIIDLPVGASYSLEVRTGLDGENWTDWIEVEGELDWFYPETNEWVGDLVPVPQSVRVHNTVQYRWRLNASPNGSVPLLRQIRLAFIDAGITPESTEAPLPDSFPKPAVVSRAAWACPEPYDSPRWPPEYEPVTHVIVHHTVTPNDDTDHAARVRSIWAYHANTRGWGDIGYNYLVDREGTLYEGRYGGDDVVGGHAYPGNYGSLGLSFMGTFCTDPVPQPMLDSAADLIAWKADQKGIDPYGWAWLYSSDPANAPDVWIHTISGHRDVWSTSCPGDVLYGHLPALRDEVASRLDALAYTFLDELDAELSSVNWHDGPGGCGYQDHAYWTFSTTDPGASTNWGRWRPDLPQSGFYRVYAYVPYCINGYPDSTGVYYRVHHSGGDTTVSVNQANAAGGWADLGLFEFNAGTEGYVYLDDLANDDWRTVWFDTIKWFWEGTGGGGTIPPNNTNPADNSWQTDRVVDFEWSPSPSPNVDGYWLLIATDPGLTDLIHETWVDELINPSYSYPFLQDYRQVYWGVEAHGPNGFSPPSGPWKLGVDTELPSSNIDRVYVMLDGHYTVHWSGEDPTSGVDSYNIEYRLDSSLDWSSWLTQTTRIGATFPYPVSETIWFRSQALDQAGLVEVTHSGDGDINTDQAVLLDHYTMLTAILGNWPPDHP